MIGFFSWLAGTRVGRWTAVIVAALAAFFVAVVKVFSAGQSAEKSKQNKASLDAYRKRSEVNDEIARQSDSDSRAELSQWVRKSDNS